MIQDNMVGFRWSLASLHKQSHPRQQQKKRGLFPKLHTPPQNLRSPRRSQRVLFAGFELQLPCEVLFVEMLHFMFAVTFTLTVIQNVSSEHDVLFKSPTVTFQIFECCVNVSLHCFTSQNLSGQYADVHLGVFVILNSSNFLFSCFCGNQRKSPEPLPFQ